MSFETSVYTNAGAELMIGALVGDRLTITGAYGGTGTASLDELTGATDVSGDKYPLQLLGIKAVGNGENALRRIPVRITGAESAYVLHQIGLFGRADDGQDTLLAVYQDDRGIEVPAASQDAGFEIIFNAAIAISRTAKISLQLDADMQGLWNFVKQEIHDNTAHARGVEITIPASAWTEDGYGEFGYSADIAIDGVTSEQYPEVAIHMDSYKTAQRAGMCTVAETLDGGVLKLWAKRAPAADMTASVLLISPKSTEPLDDSDADKAENTSLTGSAVVGEAVVGM